ncbi:error-prone DNA polymerase, partial [Microbacterium sp.]|uniref:error-prone DNA polymerase n=1 Tax=Microbacterium sp. TaxID=51671 RepID=UPI0039E44B98
MAGWNNPPFTWHEIERTLSGEEPRARRPDPGPISRKRDVPVPPPVQRPEDAVPYAELHAHSSFSFLDGASSPQELLVEAERLGLAALALTDHDGFYGAARFAEVADMMSTTVQTVYGAELSLGLDAPQRGTPDPFGDHLLVLADGLEGYHRLSGAITTAQLRGGEKGRPVYDLEELAASAQGHWTILTGCRKGAVRRGLEAGDALTPLRRLVGLFGRERVAVELFDHGDPLDTRRNDELADLARRLRLPVLATNNVHYATPERAGLAEAVAAVRAVRSMDELDGWLPAHGGAHLRSGAEMTARFRRYPGAISYGLEVAAASAFPLIQAKPALPELPVPDGHTPMSWLRRLVWDAVPSTYPHLTDDARERIARELDVIEEKNFPGYFLIVHGIVTEAKKRGILCQGRGSAAASAVCYLLGITAIDPILYRLPFERFLATTRQEEPDIDVDFDSGRREEMIQWTYEQYGRERAAQVANVIQYRPKNAVRDMARALGYTPGQQDSWSRQVDGWSAGIEVGADHDIPENVLEYAGELLKAPRHLGIHSGGMVLTARPVGEVVPVEHARMENRTVIQWDKDDAASMGLVKFDLLGLGMLAALRHCFDLIRDATGEEWRLESIPKEEPAVYDMLCRADSIGVFQVESRAQIGLLPRLQPRCFYDLAIQIALIRPGPIQGGAVHPFVKRKMAKDQLDEENRARVARGEEPVEFEIAYPHADLAPILERTLGIPIFQEQLIQMATAIGDCTADEADLLRRAMGSKRGLEKIERVRDKLYAGMARRGLSPEQSDRIYAQIQSFSNFGFAESHSLSFALLVYASSWLKLHYPAAFLAGLLRSQPMGFYSASTLTADARRHGVEVLRPDLHASGATESLERIGPQGPWLDSCLLDPQPAVARFDRSLPDESAAHRRDGGFAVRLGLGGVRGIGAAMAARIVAARAAHGRYRDLGDLARRTDATAAQLEA